MIEKKLDEYSHYNKKKQLIICSIWLSTTHKTQTFEKRTKVEKKLYSKKRKKYGQQTKKKIKSTYQMRNITKTSSK